MKKLISMLCIMVLLCSAMTLAVSAATGTPEDPIVCNDLNFNMVKVPAGATYYVSFTDTSGAAKRQISINSSTDKAAGYTISYDSTIESSDENGYCNMVVAPDANGTYFFSITNNAAKQATFFINFYDVSPYEISDTRLYEGENAVTTLMADTTLFAFEPEETAIYEVSIDNAEALLTHWNGSVFYVTGMAEEAVNGKLQVTCASVGQSLLIGLSKVASANITITKIDDYIPPAAVEYVTYVNKHTPNSNFVLPEGALTPVDITTAQTVVLGADGFYHYSTANGPILYVDMTGVQFADLYECYYPATAGAQVADRLRGTYLDADGNTCGYDFITAMRAYADALDENGYYYLTEDLANYIQMYGKDQGWFNPTHSPFTQVQNGEYVDESVWLLTSYYIPGTGGQEPVLPDDPSEPDNPDTPTIPDEPTNGPTDEPTDDGEEPDSPATGDVSALGAITALLLSSAGMVTFRKKRS